MALKKKKKKRRSLIQTTILLLAKSALAQAYDRNRHIHIIALIPRLGKCSGLRGTVQAPTSRPLSTERFCIKVVVEALSCDDLLYVYTLYKVHISYKEQRYIQSTK